MNKEFIMRPSSWHPPVEPSSFEQTILTRIKRAKLFVFLRHHRHELFDDAFQDEATLRRRVLAVETERNVRRGIFWQFTSLDTHYKLERLYPVKETIHSREVFPEER